jgi:hypothetical protein
MTFELNKDQSAGRVELAAELRRSVGQAGGPAQAHAGRRLAFKDNGAPHELVKVIRLASSTVNRRTLMTQIRVNANEAANRDAARWRKGPGRLWRMQPTIRS